MKAHCWTCKKEFEIDETAHHAGDKYVELIEHLDVCNPRWPVEDTGKPEAESSSQASA